MDELTAALAGSFEISNDFNKTSAPHPRFSQFKCRSSNSDQNSRRKHLLEIQKKNRFDYLNHVRKLTEDDWKDEEEDEEDGKGDMEVEIKKPGRYYKDQLMMSEWLVEVPSDFAEEWVMVLAPVGRRTLVVTNGYCTKAFSRSGHFLRNFPSLLPGGNRKNSKKSQSKYGTVLDCIFNELEKTYYVLDMMCWKGHSIYDTETEFRFYWLHDKLQEIPAIQDGSKLNPMKFVPLPNFPCTSESISDAIASANFEIDGLLFYHKHTHYLFGSSPLVVWLKPYMVPEILGIAVPENQMAHRPADYTNYADHMKLVGDDKAKDTESTKRDYTALGIKKAPRKKHDQEMAEDVQEADPRAGGEGLQRVEVQEGAGANGNFAQTDPPAMAGIGGGDMESESSHM